MKKLAQTDNKKIIFIMVFLFIFWIIITIIGNYFTTPITNQINPDDEAALFTINNDGTKIAYLTVTGFVVIRDVNNIHNFEKISLWNILAYNETSMMRLVDPEIRFIHSGYLWKNNLIIVAWQNNIALVDYNTKSLKWFNTGSWQLITNIWTKNNNSEIWATNGKQYWVWETQTGTLLKSGNYNERLIRVFNNGENAVVKRQTVNNNDQVNYTIININTNQTIYTITKKMFNFFLKVSTNGKHVLYADYKTTSNDIELNLVNLETKTEVKLDIPNTKEYRLNIATFSIDNKKIITLSTINKDFDTYPFTITEIREFRVEDGKLLRTWKIYNNNVGEIISKNSMKYGNKIFDWCALWYPTEGTLLLKSHYSLVYIQQLTYEKTTEINIISKLFNIGLLFSIITLLAFYYDSTTNQDKKEKFMLKNDKKKELLLKEVKEKLFRGIIILFFGQIILGITMFLYVLASVVYYNVIIASFFNLSITIIIFGITDLTLEMIKIIEINNGNRSYKYYLIITNIFLVISSIITLNIMGILPWNPKIINISLIFAIFLAMIPLSYGIYLSLFNHIFQKFELITIKNKKEKIMAIKIYKTFRKNVNLLIILAGFTFIYFISKTHQISYDYTEQLFLIMKSIIEIILLGLIPYHLFTLFNFINGNLHFER